MRRKEFLLPLLLIILSQSSYISSSENEIACIDDSDCVKLGHKYSCFLYYCHNWVDPDPIRPHCQADWQCDEGHKCYRHWNLREVDNGICYSNYQVKTCDKHSDCQAGDYCCGMYCCPQHYYRQWKSFACFSDMQCRSWKTGNYCCNNNLCCDDRKVEIQTFGIDADLDTNEISDTTGSGEEALATTLPGPFNQEEIVEESKVNTVIVPLETTTTHNQETTEEDDHEETTIPDLNKKIVIKEAITVNVSSFDLYPSEEVSDVVEEITTKATINLPVDAEDITTHETEMTTVELPTTTEKAVEIPTTVPAVVDIESTADVVEELTTNTAVVQDTTTVKSESTAVVEDTTLVDSEIEAAVVEETTAVISDTTLVVQDATEAITTSQSDETTLLALAVDPDYEVESSEITTVHNDDTNNQSEEQNNSDEKEDEDSENTIISQEETSTAASSAKSQDRVTQAAANNPNNIPRVTVDKFGRPKNRPSVHRFPSSGAVSLSGPLLRRNISAWSIIKSIVAVFIQFKLISNSLT